MDAHRTPHSTRRSRAAPGPSTRSIVPFPRKKPRPPGRRCPAIPPPDPSFIGIRDFVRGSIRRRWPRSSTARCNAAIRGASRWDCQPMALMGAYMDWAAHVAFAPGKAGAAPRRRPS